MFTRLLVTGGAGFIGSNFIRYIMQTQPDVSILNLDLLTYAGSLENLKGLPAQGRYEFVKGDICDQALVEDLLRRGEIDAVVHFAAESHVDRSIVGPGAFVQTNIVGAFALLEAARKVWLGERKADDKTVRFHHISTDEVFGSLTPAAPAFEETTPYSPNSPYAASKASSDHLVLDSGTTGPDVGGELRFGLNYSALMRAMASPFVSRRYVGTRTPVGPPGNACP